MNEILWKVALYRKSRWIDNMILAKPREKEKKKWIFDVVITSVYNVDEDLHMHSSPKSITHSLAT
jgi:hypothetical protein